MEVDHQVEMSQELAKHLMAEGAIFVFLNVPAGTDVGIDIKSWNTGENFKGIKMIPPGVHFVHYSATDEFGESAPRIGFFHNFTKSEFLVKHWDPKLEDCSSEIVPEELVQRLKDNLKELDRYLGSYPYDVWKDWKDLTDKIDSSIIERCSPLSGQIRSALELVGIDNASRPKGGECSKKRKRISGSISEEKEKDLLPDLKPVPGTELRLTPLPSKFYPDDATPKEITVHSLDTSYALDLLLSKLENPLEIIGELQMAFVCFLAGHSLDAFDHWKGLVALMCKADALIPKRRLIYIDFFKVLEVQLSHVQEDFLCDIVASNNIIYRNLRTLFANIESNQKVDDQLKSQALRFRERLTDKFFWDFNDLQDEADDETPVIVSLT